MSGQRILEGIERAEDVAAILDAGRREAGVGGRLLVRGVNRGRFANRIRALFGAAPAAVNPGTFCEYTAGEIVALGAEIGLKALSARSNWGARFEVEFEVVA